MPATNRIPHDRLAEYFEDFSKRLLRDTTRQGVDAEIVGPDIGHQQAVHGARLEGITYDPRSDTLEIALDTGDHRVERPREVWVTEAPNGLLTDLQIVRGDGAREIIAIHPGAAHRLPSSEK